MNFRNRFLAAGPIALALLAAPAVSSADVLECYSRDYQYNFCTTRDGIWVDGGCEAEFRVVAR